MVVLSRDNKEEDCVTVFVYNLVLYLHVEQAAGRGSRHELGDQLMASHRRQRTEAGQGGGSRMTVPVLVPLIAVCSSFLIIPLPGDTNIDSFSTSPLPAVTHLPPASSCHSPPSCLLLPLTPLLRLLTPSYVHLLLPLPSTPSYSYILQLPRTPSYSFVRPPTISYSLLLFPTPSYSFLLLPTLSYSLLLFPTPSYSFLLPPNPSYSLTFFHTPSYSILLPPTPIYSL
jgi:hypothetical protein